MYYPPDLPIVAYKDRIITAVKANPVVIVAGDTGSGKTTQLPKMCLEAGLGKKRLIACTQPRRIAAISVAARLAEELGEEGPGKVGYKIRFQDKTGRGTRIKFMTDGILLAEVQRDRYLRAYDAIIVDEAHERSLNIDFLLGILHRLLAKRRDLKVIVTSATIDTEKFSRKFNDAPVINVEGRAYPVEVWYRPLEGEKVDGGEEITHIEGAVKAVLELRKTAGAGDILIFMPTERDVRETTEILTRTVTAGKGAKIARPFIRTTVMPLFGRLAAPDQRRIFQPVKGQKIVVATNVAETSITVPGIRYVIDSGLARISTYSPRTRTHKLPVTPVSRASCEQRKGRCGRLGPGICVRLYSEDSFLNRQEYTPPEILRTNLAEVILRMIAFRIGSPSDFPFLDPPSSRAVKDGFNLLAELGAIDGRKKITPRGRLMAGLPLDPCISRMIIAGRDENSLREIVIIAAALSIQDPRIRPAEKEAEADAAHLRFIEPSSDFLSYLKIWDAFHKAGGRGKGGSKIRKFCKANFFSYQRLREWLDIHDQIETVLKAEDGFAENMEDAEPDAVHRAVLSGILRNVAVKKTGNMYQGAHGREVMIFPGSALFGKAGQWIMAAEFVETSKLFARTVATIKPEWIEPLAGSLCRYSYSDPHWEKNRGQVVAYERVTLFGLTVAAGRKVNFGRIDRDEARRIFIQSALLEGQLRGRFGFLEHNRRTTARLVDMEDRIRERGVLADEYILYEFYDRRLTDICDQAGLKRIIKKQGSDDFLKMTEDDILSRLPERYRLDLFPAELKDGDISWRLSYKFQPGDEDDGVSVLVPVDLTADVDPLFFEWLVPGLLLEKVIYLLKGLPKGVRRLLIPVPRTAEALLSDLTPYKGSLLGGLEQAIAKRFGVSVDRGQWQTDALPDHLKIRFCLVSENNVLKSTRNFAELVSDEAPESRQGNLTDLKKKWERSGITEWEFEGLPEKIPVKGPDGNLLGFAYPALAVDDHHTLSIRLSLNCEESRSLTRMGLLDLYCRQFTKQLKGVEKDLVPAGIDWSLYEGMASGRQLARDILTFALEEIFAVRQGIIPSRQDFHEKIQAVREKGLVLEIRAVTEKVLEILRERRLTLDHIAKYEAICNGPGKKPAMFLEFRRQVNLFVPINFLRDSDLESLSLVPRYLKALRIRIERAHASPARDAAKEAKVAPFAGRLQACRRNDIYGEKLRLLVEYGQMLEEFKISLFAQEIKTLYPVSAKRLERKWREFERA